MLKPKNMQSVNIRRGSEYVIGKNKICLNESACRNAQYFKVFIEPEMRFSAESTPRCGALRFCAALEHLHFFKVKML